MFPIQPIAPIPLAALLLVAASPFEEDALPGPDPDRLLSMELALGTELDLAAMAELSDEQRSRVIEATEFDVESIEDAALFAGHGRFDGNQKRVRLALVPVPGDGEDAHILIALNEQMRYMAGAVLDIDGDPLNEWDRFVRNLEWAEQPTLEDARPRSWLERRRAGISLDSEDEEQRLTAALLDLMSHMNEQASVFNIDPRSNPVAPHEQFEMVRDQYDAVARLGGALAPLLAGQQDEFVRLAEDSADAADSMVEPVEKGDMSRFEEIQKRIQKNCHSCHELTDERFEGMLKDASAEKRDALGIGDGFWQVGHDLRISHIDRERMQRVADAFRLGVLMLDAAQTRE